MSDLLAGTAFRGASFMRADLILEKRFHPSDLKVGRQHKLSSELSAAIVHTIRQKVYD